MNGYSLLAVIEGLPHTVDDIVLLMIRRRIKGIPLDREQCPLARYLTDETGRPVVVGAYRAYHPGEGDVVPLPQAAIDFAEEFDMGLLPRKEALIA